MADQIEIMAPNGQVRFVDLDPVKGFTNIGRHPDNDVVIDNRDVAPFHAVVDHRQKPYHVTILAEGYTLVAGQPLPQNSSKTLNHLDSIELNGHVLILLEAGAAARDVGTGSAPASGAFVPAAPPAPAPAAPAMSAPAAPPPTAAAPAAPPPPAAEPAASTEEMERIDAALSALDQMEELPPDQVDEYIVVEIRAGAFSMDPSRSSLDFQVEVEQAAGFQLDVTNGGPIVATFQVALKGIDPAWVAISPAEVNLNEGQHASFSVSITPPRQPTSRAGPHYFSAVVTSPDYPSRMCCTTGVLVIDPYNEFTVGELAPRSIKIGYTRRFGLVSLPISNLGNSDAPFRVDAEDNERGLDFEFLLPDQEAGQARSTEVTIPSNSMMTMDLRLTPRQRRLVAFGAHTYSYTVTTTLSATQETPRSVIGQARSTPLVGPWVIVLLLLILLGLSVAVFRPTISDFKVDGGDRAEIAPGDSVTLSWNASPFAKLSIDAVESQPTTGGLGSVLAKLVARVAQQETPTGPDLTALPGGKGTIKLSPTLNTTYTLKAENILSRVIPRWFTPTQQVFVVVNPLLPSIQFFVDKDTVNVGDPVVVSWEVAGADRLQLLRNDAPETISEPIGSRTFNLDRDTTFTLTAFNVYTPTEGRTKSLTVKVVTPEPTPLPLPVIQRFDVTPLEITQGDLVTISWEVTGTDSVTISGIGQLPPTGSRTARPDLTTVYALTASNGQKQVNSREVTVTVNPAPTATPLPGTPKIEYFYASPEEVAINSTESKNILLSWSITGDTTDVQISGPNFGSATGLPAQGSLKVSTEKPTLFILTAFNGDLTTSQTAQIKVLNPVPKIDSIDPSTSTDVDGPGLTLVVKGSGFVDQSKVRWEGADRATTYVSATELHATIPTDDLGTAGAFNITVFNAVPGGGTSNAVIFNLNNPVPEVLGISPTSATRGSGSVTLTVSGSNFIKGSKVRFGGVDMATTYVNTAQLVAQIPSSQLATAGTPGVTVFNDAPGGGTSNAVTFTINASNPQPTVNSLTATLAGLVPSSTTAGAASQTFDVNGSGFVVGSIVYWNTTPITTSYVSDVKLIAEAPPDLLDTVTTAGITVLNPTPCLGGICRSVPAVTFTVGPPSLTFTASNDTSILVGTTASWTVDIGASQTTTTTITLNTSASNIATVPASVNILPGQTQSESFSVKGKNLGTATISAQLPIELGGGQVLADITVGLPDPVATSLNISSKPVGSSGFDLTLTGDDFQNGTSGTTVLSWFNPNSGVTTTLTAKIISINPARPDSLVVSVPFNLLQDVTGSSIEIRAVNPGPCEDVDGNGICDSAALSFSVVRPTISGISPNNRIAGGQSFTMVVSGTNFVPGATKVTWPLLADLVPLDAISTTMTVTVPSNYIAAAGTAAIGVETGTPCLTGCASLSTQTMTITNPTISLLTGGGSVSVGSTTIYTVSITADAGSPPVSNRTIDLSSDNVTTATVPSTATIFSGSTTGSFLVTGVGFGSTTIHATLEGYSNPTASAGISVTSSGTSVTVAKVTPAGNPVVGDAVTFSATVNRSISLVPTGTVTFKSNGSNITGCANVTLSNSVAYCRGVTFSNAGTYTITAVYTPDNTNFSGSTGTLSPDLTVDKGTTQTAVELAGSGGTPAPTPVTGQSVTFNAVVTVLTGSGTPSGTVTFAATDKNSAAVSFTCSQTGSATVSLSSGSASCTISSGLRASLSAYTIAATYNGDGTPDNFDGSSGNLSQTIDKASTTVSSLSSSDTSSVFQQTVWFTATVTITTPGGGSLGGKVEFRDGVGGTLLASTNFTGSSGTQVASGGISSLSVTGSPHTIAAQYIDTSGDYNNSTTRTLTQTVSKAQVLVSIGTISPSSPSLVGVPVEVSFSLSVAPPGGGTPTGPTGTVTVKWDSPTGSDPTCTVSVSMVGVTYSCSFTPSASSPVQAGDNRDITVNYPGDSNFLAGSAVATHSVTTPTPTPTPTNTPTNTPTSTPTGTPTATPTATPTT